jgi:hypothetical protein
MMSLREKIMLRIYAIWLFRRVSPVAIFLLLFGILGIHLLAANVFVAKVFENATMAIENDGLLGFAWFLVWALIGSKLAVKVELITLLTLGFFAYKYAKKALIAYELIRRNQP